MKLNSKITLLFLFTIVLQTCIMAQVTNVSYTYSNIDFPNPERGFYRYSETYASNYDLLDSATLAGYRNLHQPFSANYNVYSTLIFRYFILDIFKNSPMSPVFLQNIQTDFNTARKAGVKLIIRFTYTVTAPGGNCGSWICPPYGDAPKSIVLQHISQLKPYFKNNSDVIAAVQMGFIGVWGEQYYTDYFGDASQSPYTLNNANWNDRRQVLDSLLSAVPEEINVQVRYPQMKQKDIYGNAAPTTSAPLLLNEAFLATNKARIGFHNDCFLANYDDYGTYANYSNGNSDTLNLKPYKAADSKYVWVGGETCDSTGLWSLCDVQGGNVLEDLNRMHYSYLNADYNNTKVNNYWTSLCMEEVKLKLGYRLHLTSGSYDNSVAQGSAFNYIINLVNTGFSTPVNKKKIKLIFTNTVTNEEWEAILDHDSRFWFQGSHTLSGSVCIPSCMSAGQYAVSLKLSDASMRLEHQPSYSIRMANVNVWNAVKGYNQLNHIVTITSSTDTCSNNTIVFKSVNRWIGPDNVNWNTAASNWSQGRMPNACDEVLIIEGKTVSVPNAYIAAAKKVVTLFGAKLVVNNGGVLNVAE